MLDLTVTHYKGKIKFQPKIKMSHSTYSRVNIIQNFGSPQENCISGATKRNCRYVNKYTLIESTLVKQKNIYVDLNYLIVINNTYNFKVRIIIFILSKFDYEH